jgi:glutaredoxin
MKLYSIENCPYCNQLKEMLTTNGINFIEIDVNDPKNEDEFNKLYEITKCDDVPMVLVKNQILIPNVSFRSIDELFGLIKQFLN